jgi:hypothetical protein
MDKTKLYFGLDPATKDGDMAALSMTVVANTASECYAKLIEEFYKAKLKPAPRWCPQKVWFWAASKFLTVEITKRFY